jgi:hypothetical protein
MPGMLPPLEPVEQPARAITAAAVAAERDRIFFIKIRVLQYINRVLHQRTQGAVGG